MRYETVTRLEAGTNEALARWNFQDLQLSIVAKQSAWPTMRNGPYYVGGPEVVTLLHPNGKDRWNISAATFDAVKATSKIGPDGEII